LIRLAAYFFPYSRCTLFPSRRLTSQSVPAGGHRGASPVRVGVLRIALRMLLLNLPMQPLSAHLQSLAHHTRCLRVITLFWQASSFALHGKGTVLTERWNLSAELRIVLAPHGGREGVQRRIVVRF
jgi:hypothetical protein